MLYAVANDHWAPGLPLAAFETRTGLYRTRREADAIAAGRRLIAVAVNYDATRGVVVSTPPAVGGPITRWSAPAIIGDSGGVSSLATIPASLVRDLGPSRLHVHAGHPAPGRPHLPGREGVPRSGGPRG